MALHLREPLREPHMGQLHDRVRRIAGRPPHDDRDVAVATGDLRRRIYELQHAERADGLREYGEPRAYPGDPEEHELQHEDLRKRGLDVPPARRVGSEDAIRCGREPRERAQVHAQRLEQPGQGPAGRSRAILREHLVLAGGDVPDVQQDLGRASTEYDGGSFLAGAYL